MIKSTRFVFSLLLAGGILIASLTSGLALTRGQELEQTAPTIHLRSRTFTPQAGVEPALAAAASNGEPATQGRLHVLLQFAVHPSAAEKAQLARQGVHLLTYVPDNAWYASVPVALPAAQQLPAGARWMGAIRPDDKLDPALRATPSRTGAPLRLVILVHPDVDVNEAAAAVAALGGKVLNTTPGMQRLLVEMPRDAGLASLAASDLWYWTAPESPAPQPRNDGARTGAKTDQVHALGYHGNPASDPGSIVVGEWDGGSVEPTHPAFTGRLIVAEPGVAVDDHATHVGGIVAGDGANSPDGRDLRGHADQAQLVSYDFNGDVYAEHQEAINTYSIDISQNSWGTGGEDCDPRFGDYTEDSRSFDMIVTGLYQKRILVVFAAGNQQENCPNGWNTGDPEGSAKNTVTVGAANSDDKAMTDFSSWGPTDDGRVKPDVVAPGDEAGGEQAIWSTLPGGGYGGPGWEGTSMAAPAVSGILGLMLEAYNQTYQVDPWPSTLKAVLINTAEDMGNVGADYQFGHGYVDALAAVNSITASTGGNAIYIRQGSVVNGGTETYTFGGSGTTAPKCTLVWDDVAGTPSATVALVNDLDLRLVDPDSAVHQPWVLDKNNPGNVATRGDNSLDNVEQVVASAAKAGEWSAQVAGDSVPQGPQSFSLVCNLAFGMAPTPDGLSLRKAVTPTGQVQVGDALTYTVTISATPGTELSFYDPLQGTTFERFVAQPDGILHSDGTITGSLSVTPTQNASVAFVARVDAPGTGGPIAPIKNSACVRPLGASLDECVWSNEAVNTISDSNKIYLPFVTKNQ